MNKVNPKTYRQGEEFVDDDAMAIERLAKSAYSVVPRQPEPLIPRTKRAPRPSVLASETG